MNTKTIDIANIGLMIFSCLLAFVIPFELFLFSYAVLGPLHYLTEITWLQKRDYFTNGKKDYILLIVFCVVFTFIRVVAGYNSLPVFSSIYHVCIGIFGSNFLPFTNIMIYLSFVAAFAFVMFKDPFYKVSFILAGLIIGFLIQHTQSFFVLFALFLPTIIHVFIFTGLFILQGALKNKSSTGVASLFVFIACGISFFVLFPKFSFYEASDYAQKILTQSGFIMVNSAFIQLFKLGTLTRKTIFSSDIGFGIMRFIAFAYTYHYLNWFSKTSVIKWHKVPKQQLLVVIVLWLLSAGLYAYDYATGLIVLSFLSMLHVFLEFPLNYRSIIGISAEVKILLKRGRPVIATTGELNDAKST
jgi:hypothetical protein